MPLAFHKHQNVFFFNWWNKCKCSFYFERPRRKRRGWYSVAWRGSHVPLGPEQQEGAESVRPAHTGPLPSRSPRARPASLLSLCARSPAPHRTARLGHTRPSLLTHTHAARTRNGDRREPERPVRRGLPARPLVTTNFLFKLRIHCFLSGVWCGLWIREDALFEVCLIFRKNLENYFILLWKNSLNIQLDESSCFIIFSLFFSTVKCS